MPLGKNKLYLLLPAACLAGYIWLFTNYSFNSAEPGKGISVCLLKNLTNIPCPSCGATRSVLFLIQGDFSSALYWNPIGIIIFGILVVSPFWLGYDFFCKKDTLLQSYNKCESLLNRRGVAFPLILLLIGNWIWNIFKGL